MIEFNDTWMTPSPERTGKKRKASPGSSREDLTPGRAYSETRKVSKALSRAAVEVVKTDSTTFQVWAKSERKLIGHVKRYRSRGITYGFQILGESRAHNGFPSQKAALERMLKKV